MGATDEKRIPTKVPVSKEPVSKESAVNEGPIHAKGEKKKPRPAAGKIPVSIKGTDGQASSKNFKPGGFVIVDADDPNYRVS